ncbi:hypothetical protein CRYUN_Cryun03dG0114000 [Craigia yunnanensis]
MIAGFQLAKLGMQAIGVFFQNASGGVKTGFISEVEVATAFMKAYSDIGGDVSELKHFFLETSCQDVVFWTSMNTALAERDPIEAFFLYRQLLREDLTPDFYTFAIVLKACMGFVTEQHALAIHSLVIKARFEDETMLKNALIHAYARYGSIALSRQVFEEMAGRDLVSLNSMLKAYACSHSELVEEGIRIFDSMFKNYGIIPQLDHYACKIDILGRAGRIIEAEEL